MKRVTAREFVHPEDRAALENMKSIPLFSQCVKLFLKVVNEQLLHGVNMATKIRLGPNQLPEIYRILPPICERFGIDEPELYLEHGRANAYTFGDTRVFITVTSGLIECMEEDELTAVIAHECGHIVCQHVLYHTMAHLLTEYGPMILGPLEAVSQPVQLGLQYWSRRSELSADRAAAVYMKDPRPVVDTMIRLAGGPKAVTDEVNVDLYMKQAEAYDKLIDSQWDKLLQGVAIMHASHPFLSVRTREIMQWAESEQFRKLVQALNELDVGEKCPECGGLVREGWKFCGQCGARVAGTSTVAMQ